MKSLSSLFLGVSFVALTLGVGTANAQQAPNVANMGISDPVQNRQVLKAFNSAGVWTGVGVIDVLNNQLLAFSENSILNYDSAACSSPDHDDTLALNSALASGQIISLPARTCYAGAVATTVDGAGLVGAGMYTTTIQFKSAPSGDNASLLFASPHPDHPGYAIHKPVIQNLSLNYGSLAPTNGALLRMQQAASYVIKNVNLEGGLVTLDIVGGGWGMLDTMRISSGGSWSTTPTGSRLVRLRQQQLAAGQVNPYNGADSYPASNVYMKNMNICGLGYNKIETTFEIVALDTLFVSNSYICGGTQTVSLSPPNSGTSAYIANIHFDNGMIDGAAHTSLYNVYMSPNCNAGNCQNLSFVGNTINSSQGDGVYIGGGPGGVAFSANNFSGNLGHDIFIYGIYSGTFSGNTLHPNGSVCDIEFRLGAAGGAAGGSLTFSGNTWSAQTASGRNLYPGICGTGTASYGGSLSITGNNFASLINPIALESAIRPNIRVSGNVGDNLPVNPIVYVGEFHADVSLFPLTQVAILTGDTPFLSTLPLAGVGTIAGTAISISNASTVTQNTTTYYDMTGVTPYTTVAAGTTLWISFDGTKWRKQPAPSWAVGPSVGQGSNAITLGILQDTIYVGSGGFGLYVPSGGIILPDAKTMQGKIYRIANNNTDPVTISEYAAINGPMHVTVPPSTVITVEAMGGKWVQLQ